MTSRLERFRDEIGVELGPLTVALFASARSIEVPCDDPIGTIYDRLPQRGCRIYIDFPEPLRYLTPTNLVLFGSTGLSCHSFGFVKASRGETTTDELAVCLHYPEAGENLVFSNLAAFLSLAAVAGTEAIEADMEDTQYQAARDAALEDVEFRRASSVLCTLPGVLLPREPSRILREGPKVELFFEKAPPSIVSIDEARRLLDQGKRASAAEVVALLVQKFLDLGDLVPRANWHALGELVRAAGPELPGTHQAALRQRGIAP